MRVHGGRLEALSAPSRAPAAASRWRGALERAIDVGALAHVEQLETRILRDGTLATAYLGLARPDIGARRRVARGRRAHAAGRAGVRRRGAGAPAREALVHEPRLRACAGGVHDLGAARVVRRGARPRRVGDEPAARAAAPRRARARRRPSCAGPNGRPSGGALPLRVAAARGDGRVRGAQAAALRPTDSRQRLKSSWCVPVDERAAPRPAAAPRTPRRSAAGTRRRRSPTTASPARARRRARIPTAGRGTRARARATGRRAGTTRPGRAHTPRRTRGRRSAASAASPTARARARRAAARCARAASPRARRAAARARDPTRRHRADERDARHALRRDCGERERVRAAGRPADDRRTGRRRARAAVDSAHARSDREATRRPAAVDREQTHAERRRDRVVGMTREPRVAAAVQVDDRRAAGSPTSSTLSA